MLTYLLGIMFSNINITAVITLENIWQSLFLTNYEYYLHIFRNRKEILFIKISTVMY